MADVFISYQTGDRQQVRPLVQVLRAEGLDVWWDQDIPPGAPWELTIEKELRSAVAVVVAWSPAAVASENVKAEARRARSDGKLIQVFVAPCDAPLFFGERQGVDLSGWNGDATDHRFQMVLEAARAVISGKPPPSGVAYAAKRRRRPWQALGAAVVAAAVVSVIANVGGVHGALCGIGSLRPTCQAWGLTRSAPPSPEAEAASAQQKLVEAVQGVWGPQKGSCAHAITIKAEIGADGAARLTVLGERGYSSTGRVIAAEKGTIFSRDTTATTDGPRAQWEYHPNGDQMTVIDKDGVSTTLVRCAPGG